MSYGLIVSSVGILYSPIAGFSKHHLRHWIHTNGSWYMGFSYRYELFELSSKISEERGYSLTAQERKIWEDKEIRSWISQSLFIESLYNKLFDDPKFMHEIMQKKIGVLRIIDSRKSFIIGDYPIITFPARKKLQTGSNRLRCVITCLL